VGAADGSGVPLFPLAEQPSPRHVLLVTVGVWLAGSLGSVGAGQVKQHLVDPAAVTAPAGALAQGVASSFVYGDRVITAAEQAELFGQGLARFAVPLRSVTDSATPLVYVFDTAAERDRWACSHLPHWSTRQVCADSAGLTDRPSP
jgi:hypothetical protein